MFLVNFIKYVENILCWKYCRILCPCKGLCLQITAKASKITKSVPCDLTSIFIQLSGTTYSSVENTSSAWDKSTSLLKSRLHKNAETFHVNKNYRLAIYVAFAVFKIEICGTLFKRYLHENETLRTSLFYTMIYFNIIFHTIWDKWQRFHSGQ